MYTISSPSTTACAKLRAPQMICYIICSSKSFPAKSNIAGKRALACTFEKHAKQDTWKRCKNRTLTALLSVSKIRPKKHLCIIIFYVHVCLYSYLTKMVSYTASISAIVSPPKPPPHCLLGRRWASKKEITWPHKNHEAMEWHEAWNVCSWWDHVRWFSSYPTCIWIVQTK